jgi:hypothetical protein
MSKMTIDEKNKIETIWTKAQMQGQARPVLEN